MSIDLSERVSRYSWAFYSGGWHRVPNPTAYYIGDASMVEYRFTTEVPLREVTEEDRRKSDEISVFIHWLHLF